MNFEVSTVNSTKLLKWLSDAWPGDLRIEFSEDRPVVPEEHPLRYELNHIMEGTSASLPFFTKDRIAWFTIAPTAEVLQAAIEDLRAWILPSFGWEDKSRPVVTPDTSASGVAELILSLSPSGYFRWYTPTRYFAVTVDKLISMRRLALSAPSQLLELYPSLSEIKRLFEVSLLTGDREAAQDAVDIIDKYNLDTAVNTQFMRVRLLDHFRDYGAIATDQKIPDIVNLRLPPGIRVCLVRAFHVHFIAGHEEMGDVEGAVNAYAQNVHELLAGVVDLCRVEDGLEARRCIAYKAWVQQDAEKASQLLETCDDSIIRSLLSSKKWERATTARPLEEKFYVAFSRGDWRSLQEIGQQLLFRGEELTALKLERLQHLLAYSIKYRVNTELTLKLAESSSGEAAEDVVFNNSPQTWSEFVDRLKVADYQSAEEFLRAENRPSIDTLTGAEVRYLLVELEDILTNPEVNRHVESHHVLVNSLPLLVKDFIDDGEFPRSGFVDVYRQLLQMWVEIYGGSVSRADSNVLLTLAEAVLKHGAAEAKAIVEAVRQWWEMRRARAMLPFLIESLTLLSEYSAEMESCETLWVEGAELIRRNPLGVTKTERLLWRVVGNRLGLDQTTVNGFLGYDEAAESTVPDPLTQAGLNKIAIVSLREEAARTASEMIAQRVNVKVVTVTETHPGKQTDSAKSADVILFVWSCSTHAVYRAFDKLKERLAYVQGTSASSILIALERWATEKLERMPVI